MFARSLLVGVLLLLSGGTLAARDARAASRPILSQEQLAGSQQGQAGIALDVNRDGLEDLVVGAPYASHRGAQGDLLVFLATVDGFRPDPATILEGEGNLGWSLASLGNVAGRGPFFAAGAPNGDGPDVSLSGSVTIFEGGSQPRRVALLEGENAFDKFGYALASGDLNGDGTPDLVVGAPFNSPSAALYQRGKVYVFSGPLDLGRIQDATRAIKIPATPANGGIGFVVAVGDVNGDGIDDLLLQATGKVLVYYGARGPAPWPPAAPDAIFKCADAGFGRAIAVIPDLDGDGLNEIAIGADQATVGDAMDSGRVYIIRGGRGPRVVNVDVPGPDRLAVIDGEPNGGRFGSALLPLRDVDGDGAAGLAVSAVHADGSPWPMTGKIFVFGGRTLTPGVTISAARAIAGDAKDLHLGSFLALVAGGRRLVAGAPTEHANTGAIRFYELR